MTIPFYTQAISSLKPGCSWRLVGDDDVDYRFVMMNYDYTKNKTLVQNCNIY